MKRWSDLPEILAMDNKEVGKVEGKGIGLLESISFCLRSDYDIFINPQRLIELIASEVCNHPEYTRYMRVPPSQEEVNHKLLSFTTNKEYSLLVSQMYIPAISSALNLHIRTIQNIADYYGVVNTYPLPRPLENFRDTKKTVTLILIDGVYYPVFTKSDDGPLTPEKKTKEAVPSNVVVISDSEEEVEEGCQIVKVTSPVAIQIDASQEVQQPQENQPETEGEEPQPQQDELLARVENLEIDLIKQEKEANIHELPDIKYESKRVSFPTHIFKGMIPDVVAQIPHDIDGTKFYMVDVPEEDSFFTKYRDGRYFDLHTSRRKGFRV